MYSVELSTNEKKPCACPKCAANQAQASPLRHKKSEILSKPKSLMIATGHDQFEQEADRMANNVVSMSQPLVSPRHNIGQVARSGTVHRSASLPITNFSSSAARSTEAPDIVHQALGEKGRPLDNETQSFMSSRFGYNFSSVRVHTSRLAGLSAEAIGANAYTSGNHIVFSPQQYAPGTDVGKRLIAHELTHVIQQQNASATTGKIQKQANNKSASPKTSPAPVCGPDVTQQVKNAVSRTGSTFGGWPKKDREDHCDALDSYKTGGFAWDIFELHNNAWIYQNYRPACATKGANPPCGSTVEVDSECSYAGSPNYVIYGKMCKLCYDHYKAQSNTSGMKRFTKSEMKSWINYYKGTGITPWGTPSGNFIPSTEWAVAGYDGWPGVSSPKGDRPTCNPTCPTAYKGRNFRVAWFRYSNAKRTFI
ncbi:DUF4157 domain-containing protein [Grimontia kaedaensis]|uniref:DUF4157 domain-containing protein n=1 Tax=Grimontia kaedaensis TaxID=2872157 RepID=A0ABY4WTM3_9GAMM|nr:DUF4157 domain-containing protein [Grimontia kaedaensis]USH01701.1 DUF4157 domain-containing protein [Grimontia kaedaensis]